MFADFLLFNLLHLFFLQLSLSALFPFVSQISDQDDKEQELNKGVSNLLDPLIVVQLALSNCPDQLSKNTNNQIASQSQRIGACKDKGNSKVPDVIKSLISNLLPAVAICHVFFDYGCRKAYLDPRMSGS